MGSTQIWSHSLSQPEIPGLSFRGMPSYASVPFMFPHLKAFCSVQVDLDTLGDVRAYLSSYSHSFLADGIGRRSPRPVKGIPLLFLERRYRALEYSPRTRHLSGT